MPRRGTLNQVEYDLLAKICERPAMFVHHSTFSEVYSYVDGIHNTNRCLMGFREWLVVKAGTGDNLGWWGVVGLLAHQEGFKDDESKIKFLGALLKEFFELRFKSQHSKLFMIFVRYSEWIKAQSWHRPDNPHYIHPEDLELPQRDEE